MCERVLALIEGIHFVKHVLTSGLEILLHLFKVFALNFIELRIFRVNDAIKAFDDVV